MMTLIIDDADSGFATSEFDIVPKHFLLFFWREEDKRSAKNCAKCLCRACISQLVFFPLRSPLLLRAPSLLERNQGLNKKPGLTPQRYDSSFDKGRQMWPFFPWKNLKKPISLLRLIESILFDSRESLKYRRLKKRELSAGVVSLSMVCETSPPTR